MMGRRLVCFAIIFSSLFVYTQNINYVFPGFDKTGMESDILYITLKALDLVEQHIQSVLETGKLAKKEQEEFIN